MQLIAKSAVRSCSGSNNCLYDWVLGSDFGNLIALLTQAVPHPLKYKLNGLLWLVYHFLSSAQSLTKRNCMCGGRQLRNIQVVFWLSTQDKKKAIVNCDPTHLQFSENKWEDINKTSQQLGMQYHLKNWQFSMTGFYCLQGDKRKCWKTY